MSVTVLRQLPLTASLDLYDFVIAGDPSTSPGIAGAIGCRAIQTDGVAGSVQWLKYGSAATDWERALGGGSGGSGGGSGVASVTGTAPITASPTSGAVVVSHNASGVTAATYGDATHVPAFTVNATGHVTAVTATAITFPPSSGASPTDTHAWQPVGALVGGVPESLFDSLGNHVMAYGPL